MESMGATREEERDKERKECTKMGIKAAMLSSSHGISDRNPQDKMFEKWVDSTAYSEYSSVWGCSHTLQHRDEEGSGMFVLRRTLKPVAPLISKRGTTLEHLF